MMSQLWMDASTDFTPVKGNERWYFQQRMQEAATSCNRVAESEDVLGYQESALLYRKISQELALTGTWWLNDSSAVQRYRSVFRHPVLG